MSELFTETILVVPVKSLGNPEGEIALYGKNLSICVLTPPTGVGVWRKLCLPWWAVRNVPRIAHELRNAGAVHAPIPGDIGTLGMLLAWAMRKPLFVRHCGNWANRRTISERFWRWFMERTAGGSNIMLATGGSDVPPSPRFPNVRWIFSSSITEAELADLGTPRRAPRSGSVRLVIAGRMELAKGIGTVIGCLPILWSQGIQADLDVLGSGPALTAFRHQAGALSAPDRVRFHGRVSHDRVLEVMKGADIFCFPTTSSEGFPKVVLEAMACGLPVVTTRVSALPKLVGGGAGILIDSPTVDDVTRAILTCLESPSKYEEMSRSAVDTARAYSIEIWQDSLASYFRSAWKGFDGNA